MQPLKSHVHQVTTVATHHNILPEINAFMIIENDFEGMLFLIEDVHRWPHRTRAHSDEIPNAQGNIGDIGNAVVHLLGAIKTRDFFRADQRQASGL